MPNILADYDSNQYYRILHKDRTLSETHYEKKRPWFYFGGNGFIAGQIPGIVTVDNIPAKRQLAIYSRETRKLLETVWSLPDGTYQFDNLDLNGEFDLVARDHNRTYNDIIVAGVQPWAYRFGLINQPPLFLRVGESWTGKASGGAPPYSTISSDPASAISSLNQATVTVEALEEGTVTISLQDLASETLSFPLEIVSEMAAQSWRINVGASLTWCSVAEIEMATTMSGPNVCSGGTGIGSTPYSGFSVSGAFDGAYSPYPDSCWASSLQETGWIGYSFPVPRDIAEIRVWPAREASPGVPETPITFYIEKEVNGLWIRVRDVATMGTGWVYGTGRAFSTSPNIIFAESYTQSSSIAPPNTTATVDSMTNLVYNRSAVTSTTSNSWIKADLGSDILVDNVILAGGSNPWVGGSGATWLEGCKLQYSTDDSTWTDLTTVSGILSGTKDVVYSTGGVAARYWRIFKAAGYVGTAQFRFTINT